MTPLFFASREREIFRKSLNKECSIGSQGGMIRSTVVVAWRNGLHLRPAAVLVKIAANFKSKIVLRCGEKVADLRSILSVVTLCASMGTGVEVEAAGEDEKEAVQAIERVFASQKESASRASGNVMRHELENLDASE